ncbi:hypothetical protein EJ04DRAFT_257694 [Polyplosphaeria fusca]|uniref:Uncharacterized protein n=1 Tax=Polyplosphaeria fusca TaxID=682080 RepID=A0A9P4V0U3_9PLEO|nr:hypothetical protein EJ04DRAFT_257694 [Polyplosphaeria fusca]
MTISEVINFNMVASWLEHCEAIHGMACLRRDSPLRLLKPIDVFVVDVLQNCLTMKTATTRYFVKNSICFTVQPTTPADGHSRSYFCRSGCCFLQNTRLRFIVILHFDQKQSLRKSSSLLSN